MFNVVILGVAITYFPHEFTYSAIFQLSDKKMEMIRHKTIANHFNNFRIFTKILDFKKMMVGKAGFWPLIPVISKCLKEALVIPLQVKYLLFVNTSVENMINTEIIKANLTIGHNYFILHFTHPVCQRVCHI